MQYHILPQILGRTEKMRDRTISISLFFAFVQIGVPLLTFPHIVTTLVLLQTRVRGGHLRQVQLPYLTFPERHIQIFHPLRVSEPIADHSRSEGSADP